MKRSVDWQLAQLRTDYIDYGMIHCLDEEKDWRAYRDGGVLDYLLDLKKQGAVRHIGLSSHTPALANQVLDAGLVELLMFSINPGYDYHHGEFANGTAGERMALYRRCEAEGIGITVMKPFSGGQLLDTKTSPSVRPLRNTSASSTLWTSRECLLSCPESAAGRIWRNCWAIWTPPPRSGTTPYWEPLRPVTRQGPVCTATTASPARLG